MRRVADQWPTFECHLPCGMRGCESHWSLKAHEWAEMRRGRDSEAGHVLLGWAGQGSRLGPLEVAAGNSGKLH